MNPRLNRICLPLMFSLLFFSCNPGDDKTAVSSKKDRHNAYKDLKVDLNDPGEKFEFDTISYKLTRKQPVFTDENSRIDPSDFSIGKEYEKKTYVLPSDKNRKNKWEKNAVAKKITIASKDIHPFTGDLYSKKAAMQRMQNSSLPVLNLSSEQGLRCDQADMLTFDNNQQIIISGWGMGIELYDGNNLTNFTKNNGLVTNNTNFTAITDNRSLWIGTGDGHGLMKFDGKNFYNYNADNSIAQNNILYVHADKSSMWVATQAGLSKIENDSVTNYTTENGCLGSWPRYITSDGKGKTWFTSEYGLQTFDGKHFDSFYGDSLLTASKVHIYSFEVVGDLVTVSTSGGIFCFKGDTCEQYSFTADDKEVEVLRTFHASDGTCWLYSTDGIYAFRNETLIRELKIAEVGYRAEFREDKTGNVWCATGTCGIFVFMKKTFTNFLDMENIGQPENLVQGENGNTWMAGGKNNQILNFRNGKYRVLNNLGNSVGNWRIQLFTDKNKTVWMATSNGISWLKNNILYSIESDTLGKNPVWSFAEDADGNIWMGTDGYGLYKYDGKNLLHATNKKINNYSSHFIQSDWNGNPWVGTWGTGVLRIKKDHFLMLNDSIGLSDNSCFGLGFASDKYVLIGTIDGGINILSGNRNYMLNSSNSDINDAVWSVCSDSSGIAYVGTSGGLFFFSPEKIIARIDSGKKIESKIDIGSFHVSDGIFTESYTPCSPVEINGRIWLGTGSSGLMSIDRQIPKSRSPELKLQFLTIGNSHFFWDFVKDSLGDPESQNNKLIFPYRIRNLAFEFSATDWKAPGSIGYKYKLDGFDNDWSALTKNNSINYSNLPDGNYTLQVKAFNNTGASSGIMLIRFVVSTPWFKQWWAFLCYAGFLCLLLFATVRQRTRYLLKRQKELELIIDDRTAEIREQNKIISAEKDKSENLLLNILPRDVADELKQKGHSDARQYSNVTVLFTDFKGFTMVAEKLTPQELVNEIDFCFRKFDEITTECGIEKIKTIGDAYMCAGGLPVKDENNAVNVVNAALKMRDFMEELKAERIKNGKDFFEIRIGVHTGPVVAGIVGIKKYAYDIWGDTVNTASRMESSGLAGKVNVSGDTYQMVKNEFSFEYRGKVHAKNKGDIDMYFVDHLHPLKAE